MYAFTVSMSEIYAPDQICVGLLHAPSNSVVGAVQSQLENTIKKESFRTENASINWRKFFERDGRLYDIKRFQIAIFSPHEDITIYVCNLADGWVTLHGNLVKANAFDAYYFRTTCSEHAEYSVYEMMAWDRGILERHVRVLQDDDGWKFLDKGNPRPFEDLQRYKKRQISARLDRALIESYSDSAGYATSAVTKYDGPCWRFSRTE
jgi:hypothetical protein